MDPITLGAFGVGTLINAVGAISKAKAAKNQYNQELDYAAKQRSDYNFGFNDIISKANQKSVYQKDLSAYNKLTEAADLNARMASGASRTSWEQSQRNQAALTSANALRAATAGARSGTDIMTAALASQQAENVSQENIGQRASQQLYEQQQQANTQNLYAIGQRAAADISENRAVQESLTGKENMLIGLNQQRLTGGIALEGQLRSGVAQAQGILSRAQNALFDVAGNAATQFGLGFLQEDIANKQMTSLRTSLEAMGGNSQTTQQPATGGNFRFNSPLLSASALQQFGLNMGQPRSATQAFIDYTKSNSTTNGLLNLNR
jgi:hypothetical protein